MKRNDATSWRHAALLAAVVLLLLVPCLAWMTACDDENASGGDGATTSSTGEEGAESGDIEGAVGEDIRVVHAVITVRALQSTFQPATPEQRISEAMPAPPESGQTLYQAYVRVKNTGVAPLRVDPYDFVCAVGDSVVTIEPTRSGPFARSLLKNTSLDLVLTFQAAAGYQPVLMYAPPWYDGMISIRPEAEEDTTTST